MKIRLSRKETAPPNLAAKSLRLGQFQPKVAANPNGYTRKVKHKKGSWTDGSLPFDVSGPVSPDDESVDTAPKA